MTSYARFRTPLGPMIAVAEGGRLAALDFEDAKYAPAIGTGWSEDPDSRAASRLRGAAGRVLRGRARALRPAARPARHALPAAHLARDRARCPTARRSPTPSSRSRAGLARLGARGRRRHGAQPARDRRALPPHRGRGRRPHRLCGRPRAQGAAARARRRARGGRRLKSRGPRADGRARRDLGRFLPVHAHRGAASRRRLGRRGAHARRRRGARRLHRRHGPPAVDGGATGAAMPWSAWSGVAIPFWLIGTAVRTIDASTAAILNAHLADLLRDRRRRLDPRPAHASRRWRASRFPSPASRSSWDGRRSR